MTLFCTPITLDHEGGVARAHAQAAQAAEHGADLVEYRVDGVVSGSPESLRDEIALVRACVEGSPLPCILTCRVAREGGAYDGPEDARIALYEGVCIGTQRPPRFLDVEWSAYASSANLRQKVRLCVAHPGQVRDVPTRLILSLHDHEGVPSDLARRVLAMRSDPACSVVKVACHCRSLLDALDLMDLARTGESPTIALGMGPFGVMTRVLAGACGGMLTFAPLSQHDATAPGQIPLDDLLARVYRARGVRPGVPVYGILGWPVERSLSPLVHNAWFERSATQGVYVPLPIAAHVASDALDEQAARAGAMGTLLELLEHPRLNLRGLSVTMPHKGLLGSLVAPVGVSIIRDRATLTTGVANTLLVERTSDATRWVLSNTDAIAISRVLRERGVRSGSHALVLGAGGMGASAAFACLEHGLRVTIANRSPARAHDLTARLQAAFPHASIAPSSLSTLPTTCDVLVQATSAGLGGLALEGVRLPRAGLVIETTYTTDSQCAQTPDVNGVDFFAMQAQEQAERFTEQRPPDGELERLAREAMRPR